MSKPEQDVIEALDELADVINEKSGSTGKKTLSQMVSAARGIVPAVPTYAGDFSIASGAQSVVILTDVLDKVVEIHENGNIPYLMNGDVIYQLDFYEVNNDTIETGFVRNAWATDTTITTESVFLDYNPTTKSIVLNQYHRSTQTSADIITANPSTGTAAGNLNALGIGDNKYTIPVGSTVTPNPSGSTSAGTLSALGINGTNYAIPQGTNVVANPTLAGTEANLTGLQVGDTKYVIPSGSGGDIDYVTILDYDFDLNKLSKRGSTESLTAAEINEICLSENTFGLNLVAVSYYDDNDEPNMMYLSRSAFVGSEQRHDYFFKGENYILEVRCGLSGDDLYMRLNAVDNTQPLTVDIVRDYGEGESTNWRYLANHDMYDIKVALGQQKPILLRLYGWDYSGRYFITTMPFNAEFYNDSGDGYSFSPLNSNEGEVSIFLDILNALEHIQDCTIFPSSTTTDAERRALNFSDLQEGFVIKCNDATSNKLCFQYGADPGSGSGNGDGSDDSGDDNGDDSGNNNDGSGNGNG